MQVLSGVLNASTGRCWSSDSYNPYPGVMANVPSSRGFQGGFAASLMEKDLRLALQVALSRRSAILVGEFRRGWLGVESIPSADWLKERRSQEALFRSSARRHRLALDGIVLEDNGCRQMEAPVSRKAFLSP